MVTSIPKALMGGFPREPHAVVPVIPSTFPALSSKEASTPGIIVDQEDRTTTLLTDHSNEKQVKKYQDMVKAQNDENQKETVYNILGSLADHEEDIRKRQGGIGLSEMETSDSDDIATIDSYLVKLN
jgi:hypothetical protein